MHFIFFLLGNIKSSPGELHSYGGAMAPSGPPYLHPWHNVRLFGDLSVTIGSIR